MVQFTLQHNLDCGSFFYILTKLEFRDSCLGQRKNIADELLVWVSKWTQRQIWTNAGLCQLRLKAIYSLVLNKGKITLLLILVFIEAFSLAEVYIFHFFNGFKNLSINSNFKNYKMINILQTLTSYKTAFSNFNRHIPTLRVLWLWTFYLEEY